MKGTKSTKPLEGSLQHSRDIANFNAWSSKSWTNPRKRPHQSDFASHFEPISNDDALREADHGKDLHASKRSRAAEWPLKNTDNANASDACAPEPKGSNDKRASDTSLRSSKFLEGSMNDKISQRPPSLYTKDEEAMEEYARIQEAHADEMDISYDAGIDSNRPSGMFRFGKAIANALKPFTVWQGINGMWKEKERSNSPEKNVLQERQAKATEAYAELKKSGYKGTRPTCVRRESQNVPAIKCEDTENQQTSFRDSGIDVDGYRSSSERKAGDKLIGLTEALLVPPPTKLRSASLFSDTSSACKSSLHVRKPSFQSLKKVTSQIHLSPVKRQPEAPPVPSIETEHGIDPAVQGLGTGPGLRRQPSKKDIAKQYKLSKKVSDLENKLDTARRELELSMSTAPPVPDLPTHVGRKPFVPGTLASLPSERNMSPQKGNVPNFGPNADDHNLETVRKPPASRRSNGRTTHDTNILKPAPAIDDDYVLKQEAAKIKRKVARPSKSLETIPQKPAGVTKRLPKFPSKTPRNSPLQSKENVPPLLAVAAKFHNTTQDSHTTASSKITDHTSVSHTNRSPSPFLGRPANASPMRTRSKAKREISPPPPSISSAKKASLGSGAAGAATGSAMEEVQATLSIDQPLEPTLLSKHQHQYQGDLAKVAIARKENAPHDVQSPSEDFEWGDDVF